MNTLVNCQECNETKPGSVRFQLCWYCKSKRLVECHLCGGKKHVHCGIKDIDNSSSEDNKASDNLPVCANCYNNKLRPRDLCTLCKKVGLISSKQYGQNICSTCYISPSHICYGCNEFVPADAKIDDNYFCKNCYQTYGLQPKHRCHYCKKIKIRDRLDSKGNSICKSCCGKEKLRGANCFVCDDFQNPCSYQENDRNKPICSSCYRKREEICSRCDTLRSVSIIENGFPICRGCDKRYSCQDCGHAFNSSSNLENHGRLHTSRKYQSKMEWSIHDHLVSVNYKRIIPLDNPSSGPGPGEFWRNVRIFDDMTGLKGGKLEADFIIGRVNQIPLWLELNGKQHYSPAAFDRTAEKFKQQQEHDLIRREYAINTPPFRLQFQEIRFDEFKKYFKDFAQAFVATSSDV